MNIDGRIVAATVVLVMVLAVALWRTYERIERGINTLIANKPPQAGAPSVKKGDFAL